MKNFLKSIKAKKISLSRVLLVVLVLVVGLVLISAVLQSFQQITGSSESKHPTSNSSGGAMGMPAPSYDMVDQSYSERAMAPSMPYPDQSGGVGAYEEEDFERLAYSARIQTGELDSVCDHIEGWKPERHVVFEQANRGENACNYVFKVERTRAGEVVEAIKTLKPREFTSNTQTVKKQFVQYDGQLSILLKKQELITQTLTDATEAFDEVLALATDVEDVETLSKVIDKKLAAIEKLTRDRISLSQQIDALTRRMAELADDVDFVQFSVYVEKYQIVNVDSVKDSWVRELQDFMFNVNTLLQNLTLGLIVLLLTIAKYVLYVGVVLVVAKYVWYTGKDFWKKEEPLVGGKKIETKKKAGAAVAPLKKQVEVVARSIANTKRKASKK